MKALVPLDGSPLALSVLPNVRRLAELTPGLEIHLFTVMDPKSAHGQADRPPGELSSTLPGSRTATAMAPAPRVVESHGEALDRVHVEAIEALHLVAGAELPGLRSTAEAVFSSAPADAISAKANEIGADLIVMATHGRSGLSHLLAGSVTESVIRHSGRPVLVSCPK